MGSYDNDPALRHSGLTPFRPARAARPDLEPSAQTGDKGPAINPLFARNISNTGRVLRGLIAVALFIGAGFGSFVSVWAGAGLAVAGGFALFEALRGWCVLRACGIKTRN